VKISTPSVAQRADDMSRREADTISRYLPDALRMLEQSQAGFPTGHEAGAGADDDVELTRTERLALTPDRARQALERLYVLLGRRHDDEVELANIVSTWGRTATTAPVRGWYPAGSATTHIAGDCRVHAAHGYRVGARRGHGDECDWCQTVHLHYGVWPNAALIDARHNGHKQRLQVADYERLLGVKRKATT
jgi:hypothetical protein